MKPWPAVIFAVDPGNKSSGWADWWDGVLVAHGTADTMSRQLALAWSQSKTRKEPFILVIEKHRPQGKWGPMQHAGMERSVGEVTGEAKRIGIPKARVHRVYPEDWRRPTLGGGRRRSATWKLNAINACKDRWKVDVGDDEAEAILIGYWAIMAPELLPYMPKKVRDAWK